MEFLYIVTGNISPALYAFGHSPGDTLLIPVFIYTGHPFLKARITKDPQVNFFLGPCYISPAQGGIYQEVYICEWYQGGLSTRKVSGG